MRCFRYTLVLTFLCGTLLQIVTPPDLFSQTSQDTLTIRVRDLADNSPIVNATVQLYTDEGILFDESVTGESGVVGISFSTSGVRNNVRYSTRLGSPYPNPFESHTTVPVTMVVSGHLTGTLYDLLGKRITTSEAILGAGNHSFDISLGSLPAGSYIFRLSTRNAEIGSVVLQHAGNGNGTKPAVSIVPGTGTAAPSAEKSAAMTFKLTVTHPDYDPYTNESLVVDGKTLELAQLRRKKVVVPIPQFGTEETRKFTVTADARSGLDIPRDLEFHPIRPNELWVVNRAFDGTVTYYNAGTPQQIADMREDVYGNHFMEEVSAIAFGADGFFGTAQETNNTYDNQAPGNNFMGPALWTSDTNIYDRVHQNDQLLGSHMDMLHESPYGMGIAHDHDNAYWYFDGYYGNIVYYDFQDDHGPGQDDHSDGIVRRYMQAYVSRIPGIPGHMILDKSSGWLYTCDPGGRRITRLNTETGVRFRDGNIDGSQMEYLEEYSQMENAEYEVFATENLQRPSGIELFNDMLFVTDNATGEIIVYDLDGKELNRLQTPAESIMGITIGPDEKIWYVDAESDQVVRLDP